MTPVTTGNGGDGHGATHEEEASIGRDAHDVMAALEELSSDLGATVREQMDRRPWVTLGLGFVTGWVLGGGLTLRVGALLLGTAGRAALAGVLERAAAGGADRRGDR